ncbi:MAG: tetratricopeptide repeat protein, partial [Candidatus Sericytochromatia bacterium]
MASTSSGNPARAARADIAREMARAFELSEDRTHKREAITIYQQVVRRDPRNAVALGNIGVQYYDLAEYDAAIEYLSKAITFAPQDPDNYLVLGRAYYGKRTFAEAKRALLKAKELGSKSIQIERMLGGIAFDAGDFSGSKALWETALRQNGEDEEAYFYLGRIAYQAKDNPLAIQHLEKAVALAPELAHFHSWLANVYLDSNRLEDARRAFKQA